MNGAEISALAFTDFDHWQGLQCESTLDMNLIQQASLYAGDTDWHERKDDDAYRYRNN